MLEALNVITPPGEVAVTLDDVKGHLRVTHGFEDASIEGYRDSAIDYVETYLRRKLITQTVELRIDRFPRRYESYLWNTGEFRNVGALYKYGRTTEPTAREGAIYLPGGKVTAIDEIRYIDAEDAEQTLTGPTSGTPGTDYQEDLSDNEHAYAYPATEWPSASLHTVNAVTIQYQVGYGPDPTDVPNSIRQAIRIASQDFFDRKDVSKAVDDLLSRHRVQIF